jgi:hypothetical protein
MSRQYYLRVVSARDGSPPQGRHPQRRLHPRDRQAFDQGRLDLTRRPSAARTAGTKVSLLVIRGNAADPHEVDLVRERIAVPS